MEPTEAINAIEVAFRELITLVWGSSWPEKTGWDMNKLQAKLDTERSMRRGAIVSSNLLDYAEFTQLTSTILTHWSHFAPALGKQKYTGVYIERIKGLRNSPVHSRELLAFERELLSGIAGELTNLVAIYRSSKGPDMQYYPVVEALTDNFGNEATRGGTTTGLRLAVGDVITFRCRATDPSGRDIRWGILVGPSNGSMRRHSDAAFGANVEISYTIVEQDVSEDFAIIFSMAAVAKYHRNGENDELRAISYAVNPPSEN